MWTKISLRYARAVTRPDTFIATHHWASREIDGTNRIVESTQRDCIVPHGWTPRCSLRTSACAELHLFDGSRGVTLPRGRAQATHLPERLTCLLRSDLQWTAVLRALRAGWIKTSAGMSNLSCRLRIIISDRGLLPFITSYTRVRWPITPISVRESSPDCSNRNLIASMGSGRSIG